jgi:hypothetical protein
MKKDVAAICVPLFLLFIVHTSIFSRDSHSYENQHDNRKILESLLKRASFDFDNIPFEQALHMLAEKGEVQFYYDRSQIPSDTKIYLREENEIIFNVLLRLLDMAGTELSVLDNGQMVIEPANQKTPQQKGIITGRVLDGATGEPLIGANILVLGTRKGGTTDPEGYFTIPFLRQGVYSVRFSYIGYKSEQIDTIVLFRKEEIEITVELEPDIISLNEIVVTPSQFPIMGNVPPSRQTLTQEDIQIMAWGEDTYRAIARLPGISSSDFSAKFTVRGGEHDQILVLLDGLELYEPFHLKDIEGGALSIIDVEAVEGIDLLTGGFTAEYGDRMSGVFSMKLKRVPEGYRRSSLGISFMNARAMSEGTFSNNRGAWLFPARRGYLDIVLDLMNEENSPSPTYYDLLGKAEYRLNEKHTLSANLLHAGDRL